MKIRCSSRSGMVLIATLCALNSNAQVSDNPNRFGLAYRMGFNITADFRKLGGYSTAQTGGFNYDNGFVFADDTTANAHPGLTWNYGYNANTPQRSEAAPTEFDLFKSTAPGSISSSGNSSSPEHGLELSYNRRFGRLGRFNWGLEAGLSYMDVSIRDDRTLHGAAKRTTDTFRSAGGAILNPAQPNGFYGSPGGPGANDPNGWPLVGIAPVSSRTDSVAGATTVTGFRELDAQIICLRLGPYLELPAGRHWSFSVSAGVSLLQIFSDFSFNQTVTINPAIPGSALPAQESHGSGSDTDFLVGVYAGGTISWSLNDRFRVFTGVQYQYAGEYKQTVAGQQAVLNLGQSIFVPIGLSFSF